MKRVALAAAAASVVLFGVLSAQGAQATLVVTAPAYVNLNVPFSVTVTVTDGTNTIPTNTDRIYVTVNRTQSNLSGLTTNGVVTINGLRATTGPVSLVVSDPARSLTKSLVIGGGTGSPPAITSANATTFQLGQSGSFTVTTTGSPAPRITCTGLPGVGFPAGVSFTDNLNGTGTLQGSPGASGTFTLILVATNGIAPNAQQTFTLTIPAAPPAPRQFRLTANSIVTGRHAHTATLLNNGKVLIAGGSNAAGVVYSTALLFDPSNETFTPTTGPLLQGRYNHTATLLNDGKVLMAGGYTLSSGVAVFAELYDPSTNSFVPTNGLMNQGRTYHAASLLADGKVLLTGGLTNGPGPLATAETYDPASGLFTFTSGPMSQGRHFQTSTTLQSGQVLVAGGSLGGGTLLSSADLYNPVTRTFTPTGSLGLPRYLHTETLLGNGFVLLAAGSDGGSYATSLLYNPSLGTFSLTTGNLAKPRYFHAAAKMQDGKVLATGGYNNSDLTLAHAELFDPNTGTWAVVSPMIVARQQHTETTLANGDVLVVGGLDQGANALSTAELFTTPAN